MATDTPNPGPAAPTAPEVNAEARDGARVYLQALYQKVDAFAPRVEAAQGGHLACRRGCDGCCRLRRTAVGVEIDALRKHLDANPGLRARLTPRRTHPEVSAGRRCLFLDDDGSCAVYEARPLICRTHGPAVRGPQGVVWCELNFEGRDRAWVEAQVAADSVIDLGQLNTILALVDARFSGPGGAREPLEAAL